MWDIVGEDEDLDMVSGDVDAILSGDLLEIGARRRALGRAKRGAALQRAAVNRMAARSVAVQQRKPTTSGRIVFGMNSSGTVAAAASASIKAQPQTVAYSVEKLTIPASIAPDFTLQDIKVGNQSQFAQDADVSAEAFLPDAVNSELNLPSIQTSQDFILKVKNESGAARQFRAVVFGSSVQ